MPDTPVKDKYGRTIDPRSGEVTRGGGVGTGVVQTETRADAYRRQKKGVKEDYPGQHESEAKKIEAEEAKTKPSPSPTPKMEPSPIEPKPKKSSGY